MDEEGDKKKKPDPIIIEGLDIIELPFSRLEELTLRLYEKLLNTREERVRLQVERDKLRTFWEITRQEVDLCHGKCLLKDKDLQETNAESNKLLKEIEDEVKYFGYLHTQNISQQNKMDAAMFSRVENEMNEEEIQLLSEKINLKKKFRDFRFENEDQLRSIQEKYLEYLSEIKISTENKLIEVEKGFNTYLKMIIDQLTLKHEMEMAEVEERKNGHITELIEIQKRQCQELKGYYNSVTKDNLTVISNLKESIDKLKYKEAELAGEVKVILSETENLKQPLIETQAQLKELKRMLSNYEKDLYCLFTNQKSIEKTINKINELKSESETSSATVYELKKKKLDYDKLFQSNKIDFKSNSQVSNLADVIQILFLEFKSKMKVLSDVINTNPEKKLAIVDFLQNNCLTVEDLQYDLFEVCKAHDDLIRSYERKLEQFGIDKNELGYKPLLLENIGLGPAGLLTKNL